MKRGVGMEVGKGRIRDRGIGSWAGADKKDQKRCKKIVKK
jgi:hypothetical protein